MTGRSYNQIVFLDDHPGLPIIATLNPQTPTAIRRDQPVLETWRHAQLVALVAGRVARTVLQALLLSPSG